jgi:hypothetical protein
VKGSALAASFFVSVRMVRREGSTNASQRMVPWCSGLAYVPVKDEIAGSNPVGTARLQEARRERRGQVHLAASPTRDACVR